MEIYRLQESHVKSDYWINELKKNTYDIKNKYS